MVGVVEHRNSQYAVYAAACMRGVLRPDLLRDAGLVADPFGSTRSPPSSSTAGQQPKRFGVLLEEIARRITAVYHLDIPNDGVQLVPAR